MLTIEQALGILKSVLDAGVKNGLFDNMDSAATATNAYNIIFDHCKPAQPAENKVSE
jgi:hypothetical protein